MRGLLLSRTNAGRGGRTPNRPPVRSRVHLLAATAVQPGRRRAPALGPAPAPHWRYKPLPLRVPKSAPPLKGRERAAVPRGRQGCAKAGSPSSPEDHGRGGDGLEAGGRDLRLGIGSLCAMVSAVNPCVRARVRCDGVRTFAGRRPTTVALEGNGLQGVGTRVALAASFAAVARGFSDIAARPWRAGDFKHGVFLQAAERACRPGSTLS